MATIVVPNSRLYTPATAEFGLRANVILSSSPLNGQTQVAAMPGDRWVMSLSFNNQDNASRAQLEALFAKQRAQVNRLSMGHPLRREPRGTMRGAPVLSGSHAAMSSTLNISGSGTLLAGDMIGVGGELKMVTADCTSGLGAVPISPPLRAAMPNGTVVSWDWPRALFIVNGNEVRVTLGPKVSPGFTVDLVEVFS